MVNINIQIPEEVHKKLKVKCAIDGTTIKDFIIYALSEEVKKVEKRG